MRTTVADIYAAGDCCEVTDLVTGRPRWWPMGSTANKQGRVVGINATGGDEAFPGVLGTQIVRAFDYTVGKVGLTTKEARECGYDVVTATVPSSDIASYYPGYRSIIMKMIADRATGRILGVQVVGEGAADKPLDACVTAITLGATVEQVKNLDLGYAPPFAPAMSVVNVAADVLDNKIKGRVTGIDPCDLQDRCAVGDTPFLLDVRTEPEVIVGAIPGVTNVPLDELRSRLGELDRDAETVLVCKVGKRAYLASGMLEAAGFGNVAILDGGMSAWPFETE
jgi:rhodanese-related sulfurtransferase